MGPPIEGEPNNVLARGPHMDAPGTDRTVKAALA